MIELALALAGSLVGLIPEPDPELRRARYVRRLAALVGRLEARPRLTPMQRGRLEGARAALVALQGEQAADGTTRRHSAARMTPSASSSSAGSG